MIDINPLRNNARLLLSCYRNLRKKSIQERSKSNLSPIVDEIEKISRHQTDSKDQSFHKEHQQGDGKTIPPGLIVDDEV